MHSLTFRNVVTGLEDAPSDQFSKNKYESDQESNKKESTKSDQKQNTKMSKNKQEVIDRDLVVSNENDLQPLVQIQDKKIELNKEPEKSTVRAEAVSIHTLESEIQPLANTEVMKQQTKVRPNTQIANSRAQKKFLIKKKKARLQSGNRHSKRWDERFYLTKGQVKIQDPVGDLYKRSKSNRLFSGKTKRSYFTKIDKELNGIKNAKSKGNKLSRMEHKWNERFNVAYSKNNGLVHRDYKEFFDRPIDYDVKGYNYT